VNLASRLEGLTKEYKLDLLLGETVAALVRDRFVLRAVDSVQVKGKTKPVRVFTVVADLKAGEQAPAWLAKYEGGLECYRARKFAEAAALFREVLSAAPDDYLAQLYLKRCEELIANPPSAEWDTVFVMKSK
jgi:adenylate cyclase